MRGATVKTAGRRLAVLVGVLLGVAAGAAPSAHTRLIEWPARAASPTFELQDVEGRRRTPADYRGQVFVVLFGFARCPDVCPAELFKLSSALKALPGGGPDVQLLFITLDPEHDTPQILRDYLKAFNPRFQGLTGSTAQVDAASSSFHANYAQVPTARDYTIDHSSSVYLFDARGRLRWIGTAETGTREYVRGLAALGAEPP